MATLAKDTPRVFVNTGGHPYETEHPVIASDIIYAGAAVTLNNSGDARPLNTGDTENGFAGFAIEKADNASGAAGDKKVKVYDQGLVKLAVTGVTSNDHVGDAVYATDDNVFTLTASGALQIGKVHRWITSTTCEVFFQGLARRSI